MANDEYVPPADEADRKVWRAVNYFDECRDIVRELAECHPSDWDMVATKAKKLWDEMLKGAGDEQA